MMVSVLLGGSLLTTFLIEGIRHMKRGWLHGGVRRVAYRLVGVIVSLLFLELVSLLLDVTDKGGRS